MTWKEEILTILNGQPLHIPLPPDTLGQIRRLSTDIPLDELLLNIHDRPEAAAIISRLPDLTPQDLQLVIDLVFSELEVPTLDWVWYVDDHTSQKSEYTNQMEFKQRAKIVLSILKESLNHEGLSIRYDVIGSYTLVTPWCDVECRNIALDIIGSLDGGIDEAHISKIVQLIQTDMKTLSKQSKVSQAGYKKLQNGVQSALRPKLGYGEAENSRHLWKTQHIRSISLMQFLLSQLDPKGIKDNWWLISPTILNILDDHEAPIKLCGVKLLSSLLDVVDPEYLKLTGLFQIFYDAMKPLLTYLPTLTPSSLSVEILQTLYPTLIKLFNVSTSTTVEYNKLLIELMTDGVFFTLTTVRDHAEIIECLLIQLILIINELKSTTVKVLPRLLYSLGMIISDPLIDLRESLFYESLECLVNVELNCWERLEGHKFDVLTMCIMSWKREKKSGRVNDKIVDAVVLLDQLVGISDAYWDELIKFDEEIGTLKKLVRGSAVKRSK